MNPKMNVGDTVPVTLTFAGGEKVTAQFPVKGPGGQ
jgi:copper(I)-binding protein